MTDIQKLTLSGRIGSFETNKDKTLLKMRVASSSYGGKDAKDVTTWWNVVVFGKRAEKLDSIIVVGSQVFVQGDLRETSYVNHDGIKVNGWEVVVSDLVFGARPLEGGRSQ